MCCVNLLSPLSNAQTTPSDSLSPTRQTCSYKPGSSNKKLLESNNRTIRVIGSSALSQTDLETILKRFQTPRLTLDILEQIADAITLLYIERGYVTSRAEPEKIENGIGQITVIEGYISAIEVENRHRLNLSYICDRIQLGISVPVNRNKLETQIKLLKADPLLSNVEASLRASPPDTREPGGSIVSVRVDESKAFSLSVGADNYSPPVVGSERIGAVANYRNLTGLGDTTGIAYYNSTTNGARTLDFNYRIPINPKNGTIQLRVAPSRSKITEPEFTRLGIRGNNDLYEISYRQPITRSVEKEFALSLGFTIQNGQTFVFNSIPFPIPPFGFGPDENGNSRTRVIKFGQEYISRDPSGAWGLRSQFSFGLSLLNATRNDAPIPDGQFFSWLGQVQRIQRLGNNHLLIAQADLQLTPDSLLPSQQFIIGGGQSIRGYRQNVRGGDNGFRISLEDRIIIGRDKAGLPKLQLAPFAEVGTVWNHPGNPNRLSNETFLAGAGLGIIWEPTPGVLMRLDYGVPLIKLTDQGNNLQDRGFYFSVSYSPK